MIDRRRRELCAGGLMDPWLKQSFYHSLKQYPKFIQNKILNPNIFTWKIIKFGLLLEILFYLGKL
jgi:hypothetical protein